MATWNILLVVNRSSNLGSAIDQRLHELESTVGSSTGDFRGVEVFVQEASRSGHEYDLRRRRLGNLPDPPVTIPNLGGSAYISGFLDWSRQQRRADREILWILSHGASREIASLVPERAFFVQERAFFVDDRDISALSALELRNATSAEAPLTIMLLEACLQGAVETAWALRDRAELLLISESWFDASGPPHRQWLRFLLQSPDGDSCDVGRMMVATFAQGVLSPWVRRSSTAGGHVATLLRPLKMTAVQIATAQMLKAIEDAALIDTFRATVSARPLSKAQDRCDFLTLLDHLADIPVPPVKCAAQKTAAAVRDVIVSGYSSNEDLLAENMHGLSILNSTQLAAGTRGDPDANFYYATNWYDFISSTKRKGERPNMKPNHRESPNLKANFKETLAFRVQKLKKTLSHADATQSSSHFSVPQMEAIRDTYIDLLGRLKNSDYSSPEGFLPSNHPIQQLHTNAFHYKQLEIKSRNGALTPQEQADMDDYLLNAAAVLALPGFLNNFSEQDMTDLVSGIATIVANEDPDAPNAAPYNEPMTALVY